MRGSKLFCAALAVGGAVALLVTPAMACPPDKAEVKVVKVWQWAGDMDKITTARATVTMTVGTTQYLWVFDHNGTLLDPKPPLVEGWLQVAPGLDVTVTESVTGVDKAGYTCSTGATLPASMRTIAGVTTTLNVRNDVTCTPLPAKVRPEKSWTWNGPVATGATAAVTVHLSGAANRSVESQVLDLVWGFGPTGTLLSSPAGADADGYVVVPEGWAYTVTETVAGATVPSYSCSTAQSLPPNGTTPLAGQSTTVTVANVTTCTYVPPYVPPVYPPVYPLAQMKVEKSWVGAPAGVGATVTLSVAGADYAWTFDASGVAKAKPASVDVDGYVAVPYGVPYTVTELVTGLPATPVVFVCTASPALPLAGTTPGSGVADVIKLTNTCKGVAGASVVVPPELPATGATSPILPLLGLCMTLLGGAFVLVTRKTS